MTFDKLLCFKSLTKESWGFFLDLLCIYRIDPFFWTFLIGRRDRWSFEKREPKQVYACSYFVHGHFVLFNLWHGISRNKYFDKSDSSEFISCMWLLMQRSFRCLWWRSWPWKSGLARDYPAEGSHSERERKTNGHWSVEWKWRQSKSKGNYKTMWTPACKYRFAVCW